MHWLFYALLAPAVYPFIIFIDKYILTKHIRDYTILPVYTSIVALVVGTIVWIASGFPLLSNTNTIIVLTSGILTAFSIIFYFRALSSEDASDINILMMTFPVISLVLAAIFLHERLAIQQLAGFFVVLGSSIGLSVKNGSAKIRPSSAFYYILLYNLFWAVAGVLLKFSINLSSFWDILSYESFGIALGGLIYCFQPRVREAFSSSLKDLSSQLVAVMFINESIFIIAKAITFFAISLASVTLVSVLEGSQAFFAIVYGYILTVAFPNVFQEDISRKSMAKKILCSVLLLGGILLIQG